jgi:hypothetical protein
MGPRHCVDTVDLHKVELAQYGLGRGGKRHYSQAVAI